jgi:hypothetical protein
MLFNVHLNITLFGLDLSSGIHLHFNYRNLTKGITHVEASSHFIIISLPNDGVVPSSWSLLGCIMTWHMDL